MMLKFQKKIFLALLITLVTTRAFSGEPPPTNLVGRPGRCINQSMIDAVTNIANECQTPIGIFGSLQVGFSEKDFHQLGIVRPPHLGSDIDMFYTTLEDLHRGYDIDWCKHHPKIKHGPIGMFSEAESLENGYLIIRPTCHKKGGLTLPVEPPPSCGPPTRGPKIPCFYPGAGFLTGQAYGELCDSCPAVEEGVNTACQKISEYTPEPGHYMWRLLTDPEHRANKRFSDEWGWLPPWLWPAMVEEACECTLENAYNQAFGGGCSPYEVY